MATMEMEKEETISLGVRFPKSLFQDLTEYANKYFKGNKTKAINHILTDYFRRQRKFLIAFSDTENYVHLTEFGKSQ